MDKKKKLIVFSADAMVTEDLEHLKKMPNYQKYLAKGCVVERVKTIYPTITYPCHTSMCTGVYPNKHGIYGNIQFIPGLRKGPWKWFLEWRNPEVEDIFTAAKRHGLTTAAVFWPVTGNHPDIDYLIDEYWPQYPGDDFIDAFRRSGSSEEVLEVVEKFREGTTVREHPSTDYFIVDCTCEIIRRFQPDLLMIHPANIDSYRHKYGLFNDKVTEGIEETDRWIGQIMEAVEEAGLLDVTNFVLTSDHGQMDIKRVVNPNVFLADAGLIKVENGRVVDWDAYFLSGGFSGLVYLKDPTNREIYDKTYSLLKHMVSEGIYGMGQVFTEAEINEKEKLGGDFAFVVESDGFSSFGEGWERPIVTNFDVEDYRYGRATHGYLPDKGPQPIFIAAGPDFNEGVVIDRRPIVDEAPTYAAMFGFDLPGADGKPILEFIRHEQEGR